MQSELDKLDDFPKASSFTNKVFAGFGFAWLFLGIVDVRLVTEICLNHEYWSAYNWMPLLGVLFFGFGWGVVTFMIWFLAFAKRHGLKKGYVKIILLVFPALFFGVGLGMIYSETKVFEVAGGRLLTSFMSAGFCLKMSTAYALLQSELRKNWKS